MRYSIMLQLVIGIGLFLLGSAALFAWFQNRHITPTPPHQSLAPHQPTIR